MYQFHCWAVVRQSTLEDDGIDFEIARGIETEAQRRMPDIEVRRIIKNGMLAYGFSGMWNRPTAGGGPVEVLKTIGLLAPGSYGLLYVHDDEGDAGNEFVVWVLAKGTVTCQQDQFLSPRIPKVDDDV